jgi:hypothetical protein
MPIMSKVVSRTLLCLIAIFVMAGSLFAKEAPPEGLTISTGERLVFQRKKLFLVKGERIKALNIPLWFRRKLFQSSDVVFPESSSRHTDGRDVFLVVTEVSSSPNPNGYCGAGSEDELYALELKDGIGRVIFSKKVSSCLDDVNLSEDGVNSPFNSIKWTGDTDEFSISWEKDQAGKRRIRYYRIKNGAFMEFDK